MRSVMLDTNLKTRSDMKSLVHVNDGIMSGELYLFLECSRNVAKTAVISTLFDRATNVYRSVQSLYLPDHALNLETNISVHRDTDLYLEIRVTATRGRNWTKRLKRNVQPPSLKMDKHRMLCTSLNRQSPRRTISKSRKRFSFKWKMAPCGNHPTRDSHGNSSSPLRPSSVSSCTVIPPTAPTSLAVVKSSTTLPTRVNHGIK